MTSWIVLLSNVVVGVVGLVALSGFFHHHPRVGNAVGYLAMFAFLGYILLATFDPARSARTDVIAGLSLLIGIALFRFPPIETPRE